MRTRPNRCALPWLITALAMMTGMLSGCDSHADTLDVSGEPRGKITLGVIRHGVEREPDRPLRLLGERYALELNKLYLVIADLEVHACEDRAQNASWSLFNEAHAHVPESATRLGTPTLDDLTGPVGRARIIGEVAPPRGRYCRLRVVMAPADDDVVNLSTLDMDELVGHGAVVDGRWRRVGEQTWQPFTHRLTEPMTWFVELPEPITLSSKEDSAFVLVDTRLDGAFADSFGERLTTPSDRALDSKDFAHTLLELVGQSQRRYISPAR